MSCYSVISFFQRKAKIISVVFWLALILYFLTGGCCGRGKQYFHFCLDGPNRSGLTMTIFKILIILFLVNGNPCEILVGDWTSMLVSSACFQRYMSTQFMSH